MIFLHCTVHITLHNIHVKRPSTNLYPQGVCSVLGHVYQGASLGQNKEKFVSQKC